MPPDDALEPTLLGAIRKYWWLVGLMTILGGVIAWFLHSAIGDEWVAEASMLVENPENSQLFDQGAGASPERYAADQVAILESTPVARRALEISEQPAGSNLTIEDFTAGVEVISSQESGSIVIRAAHDTQEGAVRIANSLLAAYEESKETEAAQVFESAIAEFDSSIAAVDTELDEIASEIAALRSPSAEGADFDAQLQGAIEQLLGLINQSEQSPEALESVLQQLQTLQLIRSVQAENPALATLAEARDQALDRRSQLALRRDQLRVDAALTTTGIVLISEAETADQAFGLGRTIAMGVLIGAVVGSGAAFALANRSQRFNHRAEPEIILNAPLLAAVPEFEDENLRTPVPARDAPRSIAAESFRFAAATLAQHESGSKVVAVASPSLGDGKSVVTANLGTAVAGKGRRVLLIDCDFGNPSLADIFGVEGLTVGLTDVVESSFPVQAAVTRVEVGDDLHVDLLTRGSRGDTAPTFFRSADTESFFQSVRSEYDLVLVDTPPLLQVAYAQNVVGLCDLSVIVTPHHGDVTQLIDLAERFYLTGARTYGYIYNRSPLDKGIAASAKRREDVASSRAARG